jgi:hypothetical protein
MAEEHPPSLVLKGVPFAWEIAGLSFREYGTAMTARGSVCLFWLKNKKYRKNRVFCDTFSFWHEKLPCSCNQ